MPQNLSFIGAGELWLAPRGTKKFISVLNLSSLKITPETDEKDLANTMTSAGGSLDTYTSVTGVSMALGGISQYSKENMSMLLKGGASAIVGGAVAGEEIVANAGYLTPVNKLIDVSVPVVINDGVAVVPASSYLVTPAGIRFLAPAAGFTDGDVLTIDYTALACERVDALTNPSQEYEAMFIGLNKADGGKPVVVHGYRLRLGVGGLDLISESNDFAKTDLSGKLLVDTSKTGVGISQYLDIRRA